MGGRKDGLGRKPRVGAHTLPRKAPRPGPPPTGEKGEGENTEKGATPCGMTPRRPEAYFFRLA